jgi:signal transduction histidine kinase
MTAPLALRRRWPLAALVVTIGAVGLLALVEPDFSQAAVPLSLGVAMFAAGREVDLPRSLFGLGVIVGVGAVLLLADTGTANDTAIGLLVYGSVWGFGVGLRRRAADVARVAAGAELERAAAVDAERARIARELHDVVSHSLSLVAIQTQAVRRRLGPEAAREAADLEGVERAARDALAEMRRLLGVLRSDGDDAPLAPQPGLDQLDGLAAAARAAGLAVDVAVEGEAGPLSPGVDLAAYRIVQEALTNVRRHAGASRATVRVRHAPGALDVSVCDDGRGLPDVARGGRGLVGMRERVALYGGTLAVVPGDGGRGVCVRAVLPLREGSRA